MVIVHSQSVKHNTAEVDTHRRASDHSSSIGRSLILPGHLHRASHNWTIAARSMGRMESKELAGAFLIV